MVSPHFQYKIQHKIATYLILVQNSTIQVAYMSHAHAEKYKIIIIAANFIILCAFTWCAKARKTVRQLYCKKSPVDNFEWSWLVEFCSIHSSTAPWVGHCGARDKAAMRKIVSVEQQHRQQSWTTWHTYICIGLLHWLVALSIGSIVAESAKEREYSWLNTTTILSTLIILLGLSHFVYYNFNIRECYYCWAYFYGAQWLRRLTRKRTRMHYISVATNYFNDFSLFTPFRTWLARWTGN